jgi:hypothetical protein
MISAVPEWSKAIVHLYSTLCSAAYDIGNRSTISSDYLSYSEGGMSFY